MQFAFQPRQRSLVYCNLDLELESLERELQAVKGSFHIRTVVDGTDSKGEKLSRYWTKEERQRFEKALKIYGTDFSAIATYVGTRNSTQVRTHAQKYFAKLVRDYKRYGQVDGKDKMPPTRHVYG